MFNFVKSKSHENKVHGKLADPSWSPPKRVTSCDKLSRPGYSEELGHEYLDTPAVLEAKVALLATFIQESKHCIVYSGAGISTSAGIADYGSVSDKSITKGRTLRSPMTAEPTLSHYALVGLHRLGKLKSWIQQNHDGLPQKAGMPQHCINEIHGSLYDPSNPVIPMSGTLRDDLFSRFQDSCKKADLCLSMGTSLSGMNCDQCVQRTAARLEKQKWNPRAKDCLQFGSVIVGLQQTPYNNMASLCIYAKLDDFSEALIRELKLEAVMPKVGISYSLPSLANTQIVGDKIFLVPYSSDGMRLPEANVALNAMLRWDLSEGARVKLKFGPFVGDEGDIVGLNRDGHIKIRFFHPIGKGSFKAPMERTMGLWWIQSVIEGSSPYIPFVNV